MLFKAPKGMTGLSLGGREHPVRRGRVDLAPGLLAGPGDVLAQLAAHGIEALAPADGAAGAGGDA